MSENVHRKVGRPQSEYKTQFLRVTTSDGVTKWRCKFCEMEYGPKTGTANFKRHLMNHHPECFNGSVASLEQVMTSPYHEEFSPLQATRNSPGSSGQSTSFYGNAVDSRSYSNLQNDWADHSSIPMAILDPLVPHIATEPRFMSNTSFSTFSFHPGPSSPVLPIPSACNGRPCEESNSWQPNWQPESQWERSSIQYQAESMPTDAYSHQWSQPPISSRNDQKICGQINSPSAQIQNAPVANLCNENLEKILGNLENGHLHHLQQPAMEGSVRHQEKSGTISSPQSLIQNSFNRGSLDNDHPPWQQHPLKSQSNQQNMVNLPLSQLPNASAPSSNFENRAKLQESLSNSHLSWQQHVSKIVNLHASQLLSATASNSCFQNQEKPQESWNNGHLQCLQHPTNGENNQQNNILINSPPSQLLNAKTTNSCLDNQENFLELLDNGHILWPNNPSKSENAVKTNGHVHLPLFQIQDATASNPYIENRNNLCESMDNGHLLRLQHPSKSENDHKNTGQPVSSPPYKLPNATVTNPYIETREKLRGTMANGDLLRPQHPPRNGIDQQNSFLDSSSLNQLMNLAATNSYNENREKFRGTMVQDNLPWLQCPPKLDNDQKNSELVSLHPLHIISPCNENREMLPETPEVRRDQLVATAYFSSGTKRKLNRNIAVTSEESASLDMFTRAMIDTWIREGFSKGEILEKMLTMTVCNPMYLHAFLNDNMHDFFTIVHPQFPNLSLNLIDDELFRRKRESLKSLLRENCDTRWSPLLFDVFVFPLRLDEGDPYAIVELVYLDKNGQRRSCLLDCVLLSDQLCYQIARNLRAFEVDSKLCNCAMWGRKYEMANAVLQTELKCRRRSRADGCWGEEEKKKQFFSVLKKTQEDQSYNIQMEVVQCLSCLDQLEETLKQRTRMIPMRCTSPNYGVDMKTILSEVLSDLNMPDFLEWDVTEPSVQMTERFLAIVYRKFKALQRKMEKLGELGGDLKQKLNRISRDKKYAVYYIHKNQKNVNLLHIIPVTSYEDSLKDICHYLKNFMELLKNPGLDGTYEMSDLVDDMDMIEIEDCPELACNKDTVYEPKALFDNILKIFQDWRKIFQQGVALSVEYISLCNYFTGYRNHESNIQSLYAKEFCDVARSAPPHMAPEKWKRVAFLRAWDKFESNYY